MPISCAVFIASSLDGFIARPDGAIDWLEQANQTVPAGEDCGYAAFMADVDLLVMGRNTFDKVMSFPEWPYAGLPVWVVTRTPLAPGQILPAGVHLTAELPGELADRARQQGYRKLYIDGGRLIQSFLQAGLISEITVTSIPVLLGQGRRLFDTLPGDIPLKLLSAQAYPFGFVQSRYQVLPPAAT
ncbi:dihydrofolate reductase family protein [Kerstersia sp.]|uniref:dihydrofolate reductase family protein n=1 Tax=Kerstersia sp. TaxID=1930783 RepID=UPI003F8E376D